MTPERSSDATITTVDLSVASSDHSFVGLSTYMAMVLAGWQAMLLPYLMTLPALVGLICGATALLVSHTPTKLRFALVAQLSVLPGAMLLIMLLVGSLINLSAHLDPFGLANTETLRSIISSFGTTDTAGLAVSGALPLCTIFFFVPSFWRLARGAYPPTTKLALRSAFRAQTSAVRQHKRFSLWCIPVLLSVPLLLALSFLLHVIVRPFGGPFMNALSLAPQYPVSWIKDFMRFYKQRTQLGVKEALAYDKRAPILLLRSFDDDHIAYAPWELQERSPRLASLNTLRFVLEEALAKELSRKGPPIAIGAPGEVLPPIGAYRQYCGEAEWQGVVLERMSEAQSIVVIASETRWLSWELEQIAKNNYVEKCMLFFPPLEPFAHADRVTAVSRAISSFLPPAASTAITAPGLVALLFGSSNSITALFDKTQSKESYILAVQAGLPVT